MKLKNSKKGIGLVEILIAIFIFTVVLLSLITVSNLYLSGADANLSLVKSAYLAEEGVEAVKTIRDSGWANISALSTTTVYYFYFNPTSSIWQATTTKTYGSIDSFVRSFTLGSVNRTNDTYHRISASGVSDPNTKLLTVSVSWQNQGATTTKSISTYITNLSN
jgi:Tfp pilus assembly protein PilV